MELTAFCVAEGLALRNGIPDQQIEIIMVLPPIAVLRMVVFAWRRLRNYCFGTLLLAAYVFKEHPRRGFRLNKVLKNLDSSLG